MRAEEIVAVTREAARLDRVPIDADALSRQGWRRDAAGAWRYRSSVITLHGPGDAVLTRDNAMCDRCLRAREGWSEHVRTELDARSAAARALPVRGTAE